MERNILETRQKVDRERFIRTSRALTLLKELSFANFDETVEVHVRTGLDPRQADQQVAMLW